MKARIPYAILLAIVLATRAALLQAQNYTFSTIAGHGGYGSNGDGSSGAPRGGADGKGDAARFYTPSSIVIDRGGNLFIADTYNHTIRKITPDGTVTTVAGVAGVPGGADGVGTAARFYYPADMAIDASGTLYVADTGNDTIRRISSGGLVTTIAGPDGGTVGKSQGGGYADGTGAAARFNAPNGIAFDPSGNLVVADSNNHVIRKVTPAGVVTTLAGRANEKGAADGVGSTARFNNPHGIAVDARGNIFVADTDNNTIRKITSDGTVTTFAGNAAVNALLDGVGTAAGFALPRGLTFDPSGNLYVADSGHSVVRKITPDAQVTIVAGGPHTSPPGIETYNGPLDGPGAAARFNHPGGVAINAAGTVFVADSENNLIRQIAANGMVTTFAGAGTSRGSVDGAGSVARFNGPRGVASDGRGGVYVADMDNHTIRRVGRDGSVSTVAGRPGEFGSTDGNGSAARFFYPYGVAVDAEGTLFVADTYNHTIRKISPTGAVSTLAGHAGVAGNIDGAADVARFKLPEAVAVDRSGNLFVGDAGNASIRKIAPSGIVTTIAKTKAPDPMREPLPNQALAVDGTGVLYFVDGNHICKLALDDTISTVAGGAPSYNRLGYDISYGHLDGQGGLFTSPMGLAVDDAGNVFVADGALRWVRPSGFVTTLGAPYGSIGAILASGVALGSDGVLMVSEEVNDTIVRGDPAVFSRLTNFSILTTLEDSTDTVALGVKLGGNGVAGTAPILVRAAGPSLASLGLTGLLPDPKIEFYSGQSKLAEDDDWLATPESVAAFARLGAFPFTVGTKDAALGLLALPPGSHTARISGTSTNGGTVLAEIYADPAPTTMLTTPRLTNLSVLKNIGKGMTAGFTIAGTESMRVLIRAVGPSLARFGVANTLADPRLELFNAQGQTQAQNDNWAEGPTAAVILPAEFSSAGAFALASNDSKDAALVATLAPGSYTIQVRSADASTGVVLAEIYEMP